MPRGSWRIGVVSATRLGAIHDEYNDGHLRKSCPLFYAPKTFLHCGPRRRGSVNQSVPVFIVHWNRPQECLRAVDSFLAQDVSVRLSIIDNASDPNLLSVLIEGLPPNVKLIRLPENRGWGGGLNVLLTEWLKENESQFCFVSAHDALPQAKCLSMLLDSMQEDSERIGIACAELGAAHFPKFSPILGPRLVDSPRFPAGTVQYSAFPHGTLMLFNRDCIEQIGLFDERYFAYGDEMEIGLRAVRHGWKNAVVWGAIVVNPGSWTPSRTLSYLASRNALLMAHTYGCRLSAALRAAAMIPNTLRLLLTPSAQGSAFSPLARAAAIRDYFLGRFGPPPAELR
jgi:N-acetylglucosaminyl-diphospho-decaprenol L-rhamnosyltransferase